MTGDDGRGWLPEVEYVVTDERGLGSTSAACGGSGAVHRPVHAKTSRPIDISACAWIGSAAKLSVNGPPQLLTLPAVFTGGRPLLVGLGGRPLLLVDPSAQPSPGDHQ